MAKYERRQRPGFMIYHEDVELLSNLAADDFKALTLALAKLSADLAQDQENEVPAFSGWSAALWGIVSAKVIRDHENYIAKCNQGSTNRRKATMVNGGQPASTVVDSRVTEGRPEATNSNSSSNSSGGEHTRDARDPLTVSDEEVRAYQDNLAAIEDVAKSIGLPFAAADCQVAEQLMAEYSAEWVLEAIKRAQDRNRTWGVVKGILRSWKDKGGIDDARYQQNAGGNRQQVHGAGGHERQYDLSDRYL